MVHKVQRVVDEAYFEDENMKLHLISRNALIFKDSEMTGTLKDGRRVWNRIDRKPDGSYSETWVIPFRVAKGEVAI